MSGALRVTDGDDQRRRIQAASERSFKAHRFADAAGDVLRDLILEGTLQQGERINEVALAETLNISRTPIREALQALAGEGLVQLIAGRGAFVATLNGKAIEELVEVRIGLESHAARLAAERISDDQLAAIDALLTKTEGAVAGSGHGYPGDLDFHKAVLEAAGNSRLAQTASAISTQLRLARAWSGQSPSRATSALSEHEAVYAALKRRDPAAAERAMRKHLEQSAKNVRSLFARRGAAGR